MLTGCFRQRNSSIFDGGTRGIVLSVDPPVYHLSCGVRLTAGKPFQLQNRLDFIGTYKFIFITEDIVQVM